MFDTSDYNKIELTGSPVASGKTSISFQIDSEVVMQITPERSITVKGIETRDSDKIGRALLECVDSMKRSGY